ncbi:hypothetical protein SLS59_002837 [Nothophoma quercina]|uniref:NAD(P)-binding protein n=1 Tax=Nothophoma quercina TaxID=749835 RepID=A0ABR3RRS7_9PLEO
MSSKPIVLILGSGPRVGAAVAKQFANTGYSVAVASRKAVKGLTAEGYLSVKADLSDPLSLPAIFDAVKAEFHSAPSVVVYNAAALTPPTADDLFSIPVESLAADLNINTVSAYAAAQEAVKGWKTLATDSKKPWASASRPLATFSARQMVGTPKRAIGELTFDMNRLWAMTDASTSFFYADERNADGSIKGMQLDGDAHADFYAQLASGEGEVPWHATFVKGQGYVRF